MLSMALEFVMTLTLVGTDFDALPALGLTRSAFVYMLATIPSPVTGMKED